MQALHYDYLAPRLPNGTTEYFWELAAKTYKRWREEGKGPLLGFPPEIETRGWEALHGIGLPQGGWFVALHVREGKWDGRDAGLHGILNSDMATYLPAINEITRRGGWVIRMGDPGMTRCPAFRRYTTIATAIYARTGWTSLSLRAAGSCSDQRRDQP